jgi:peptidylprolyl isomerase
MSMSFTRRTGIFGALAGAFVLVSGAMFSFSASAQEGAPHCLLEIKGGMVDIELLPNLAPQHVERIVTLTNQGFYNGVVFHRVIPGFMAQGGDPTGTGMGGSELPDLPAEFSPEPFVRGVVAAARSMDPNSANSQFFITFADAPHLNNQYTVFGKVVSGMELVDGLAAGSDANNGAVQNPDKIISAKIEYRN